VKGPQGIRHFRAHEVVLDDVDEAECLAWSSTGKAWPTMQALLTQPQHWMASRPGGAGQRGRTTRLRSAPLSSPGLSLRHLDPIVAIQEGLPPVSKKKEDESSGKSHG
jgi:hypothetical protein